MPGSKTNKGRPTRFGNTLPAESIKIDQLQLKLTGLFTELPVVGNQLFEFSSKFLPWHVIIISLMLLACNYISLRFFFMKAKRDPILGWGMITLCPKKIYIQTNLAEKR